MGCGKKSRRIYQRANNFILCFNVFDWLLRGNIEGKREDESEIISIFDD
jgi:hypothetical protein